MQAWVVKNPEGAVDYGEGNPALTDLWLYVERCDFQGHGAKWFSNQSNPAAPYHKVLVVPNP
jgi:hypothetical protein